MINSSIDAQENQTIIIETETQSIRFQLTPRQAIELEAELHWNTSGRPDSRRPASIMWEKYGI